MKISKIKAVALSFLTAITYLYSQNNLLELTKHTHESAKIPKDFDGLKILHLSDLQNKSFGKNNWILLKKIARRNPDIIVFTGDLLDRNRTNVPVAISFMEKLVEIAPVFFVSGNHEHQAPDDAWSTLVSAFSEIGVTILDNDKAILRKNDARMTLLGLADPMVNTHLQQHLKELLDTSRDNFNILLCHHPELFADYVEHEVDIAFTGHAHGGQIRLPLLGGIFAPHQGFFPKYSNGVHTQGETTMYVSRGLGNSRFPFRINNRPQILLITLSSLL
ncbi:MAG: metallophosphoesterase [Bacillota bacterium]